jgi:hypothetical protein
MSISIICIQHSVPYQPHRTDLKASFHIIVPPQLASCNSNIGTYIDLKTVIVYKQVYYTNK